MTTDHGDRVELDVAIPEDLLTELDEYRTRNGYPSRSAVVTDALQE